MKTKIPMALVLTVAAHSMAGEMDLSGTQEETIVELTAQRAPYVLTGTYIVPAGKELHIAEGTTIVAARGARLAISGKIRAEGSLENPVILKGKGTGAAYWQGVALKESVGSELAHVKISGAETACDVQGGLSVVKIRGCVVRGNTHGLKLVRGRTTVENCLISGNQEIGVQTWCGAALTSCTVSRNGGLGLFHYYGGPVRIEKCVVTENRAGGIQVRDLLAAQGCVLSKNRKYDVINDAGSADRDFSGNWWGSQSTRRLIQNGDTANLPNILDGQDDSTRGLIRIDGFLKKEPESCGASLLVGR